MLTRILVAGAIACAIPVESKAGFENGNTLYQKCTNKKNDMDLAYCIAYISAISDALDYNELNGSIKCSVKGITAEQARNAAVFYLYNNPKIRHYSADNLVAAALSLAFP